jgi:predicted dinucleotide-binding enzyme
MRVGRRASRGPTSGRTDRPHSYGHVLAKGERLDAFIAADDPEAKARVSTFIESLGLRPLDVGGLHMAATLEALGLMMIGLAKNGAGTWDIALNVDIG